MLGISRQGKVFSAHALFAVAAALASVAVSTASAQDAAMGQDKTVDTAKKEGDSRNSATLPPAPMVNPPPRVGEKISLSAGLDFSSHFISFGADVWGGGSDEPLPFEARSTSFLYGTATSKFTDEISGYANIWSDLNDNVDSGLGGPVQEIDVNLGFTYALDKFTFGVAHNYWMFGGDTEQAFEASVGYNDMDTLAPGFALNPSVLVHYRYDGQNGQHEGAVLQAGIRPTFLFNKDSAYPITLAVPTNAAFFVNSYQNGDSGFGYANVGLSASVPLAFIPQGYGAWTGGLTATLWYTPDYAIPGNPDEVFVVTALSFNVAF